MRSTSSGWSGTPAEWFGGLLDAVGSQPSGRSLRQCPAHEDTRPSLSLTERRGGTARLRCFAGCDLDDILQALRCGRRQLYEPPAMPPAQFARLARLRPSFPPVMLRRGHPAARGYRLEAVHPHGPADGTQHRVDSHRLLRWRLPSTGDKELEWETRLRAGGSVPGLMGTPERLLPLYHERQMRMATSANEPVLVVESESSADAIKGWYATTWAGGAGHVNTDRLAHVLGGYRHQLLIPDHDPAGRACLRKMLAAGLGPAVLLGEMGEDARELYLRLGSARFTDVVEHVLRVARTATGPVIVVTPGNQLRQVGEASLGSAFKLPTDAGRTPAGRSPAAGPAAPATSRLGAPIPPAATGYPAQPSGCQPSPAAAGTPRPPSAPLPTFRRRP